MTELSKVQEQNEQNRDASQPVQCGNAMDRAHRPIQLTVRQTVWPARSCVPAGNRGQEFRRKRWDKSDRDPASPRIPGAGAGAAPSISARLSSTWARSARSSNTFDRLLASRILSSQRLALRASALVGL